MRAQVESLTADHKGARAQAADLVQQLAVDAKISAQCADELGRRAAEAEALTVQFAGLRTEGDEVRAQLSKTEARAIRAETEVAKRADELQQRRS